MTGVLTLPLPFHVEWEGIPIGTLVERSTRLTMLLHLPGDHTAETVATAMIETMSKLLNRRPRPTLNLDTPAQRLAALLEQAAA